MFAESLESEREKWGQLIARLGFHFERGMKIDTFLFTHPIGSVIQDQNLHFVGEEVKGYLPTMAKKFYSNLREDQNVDTLLETTILGKQLRVNPDLIAQSLNYVRPATHDRPYPLKAITEFDASCLQMPWALTRYPWEVLCARSSFQGN